MQKILILVVISLFVLTGSGVQAEEINQAFSQSETSSFLPTDEYTADKDLPKNQDMIEAFSTDRTESISDSDMSEELENVLENLKESPETPENDFYAIENVPAEIPAEQKAVEYAELPEAFAEQQANEQSEQINNNLESNSKQNESKSIEESLVKIEGPSSFSVTNGDTLPFTVSCSIPVQMELSNVIDIPDTVMITIFVGDEIVGICKEGEIEYSKPFFVQDQETLELLLYGAGYVNGSLIFSEESIQPINQESMQNSQDSIAFDGASTTEKESDSVFNGILIDEVQTTKIEDFVYVKE